MSFPDAAAFLLAASLRNRVRAQWRRLRQPKYLVFTILGLLYFWQVFFRGVFRGASQTQVTFHYVEPVLGAIALLTILGTWVLGGDKAVLGFTEAEVSFFFAGPVGRRALIHFRLVRSLMVAFFSALLIALFRARAAAHLPFFFVGAWLGLAMLSLHTTGAALTRASLAEHGIAGWRRRLLTLAVILFAIGALVWWAARSVPALPHVFTPGAAWSWAQELVRAPPLRWVLVPITAPLRVAFAASASEFFAALPAALLVVAAHYAWAVSSSVAFEEAAAEASERRARFIEARRSGQRVIRRGRPLFALPPLGARWLAITWKNLLAGSRVLSLRVIVLFALVLVSAAVPLAATAGPGAGRTLTIAASLCGVVAVLLALLGPHALRSDLRMDLANMDLLRSYPLSGREVVTASIAAPAFVLIGFEVFFLLLAVSLSFGVHPAHLDLGIGARLASAWVAASTLAAVTISGLLLRNAIVLFLPGWVTADRVAARGPEAIGQRMLLLAGTLVLLAIGLIPCAIVGAVAAWALFASLGSLALLVGAVLGAVVFAVEVYFALLALGHAFERFDLSAS